MKKMMQLSIIIFVIILMTSSCKKKNEDDVEVVEEEVKDTTDMSFIEKYNLYYKIDLEGMTIDWYDGHQLEATHDIAKSLSYNTERRDLVISVESIYEDDIWLKIAKDGIVYGFMKSNIADPLRLDFYHYSDWAMPIRDGHYVFCPAKGCLIFDNMIVDERLPEYERYEKEKRSAGLFYNHLFDGTYINKLMAIYRGSDISYTYDEEKGFSYLLTKDTKIHRITVDDIEELNISLNDYTEFEDFTESDTKQLVEPDVARLAVQDIHKRVMTALDQGDFKTLSKYVHGSRGLRLVPFDRSIGEDVILSIDYLKNYHKYQYEDLQYFGKNRNTDELMYMSLGEYFEYFLYPIDYVKLPAKYNMFYDDALNFLLRDTSIKYYHNPMIVQHRYKADDKGSLDLGERSGSIKVIYEEIDHKWYAVMIMNN